jgi:tRNA G18 (ribose-2'-O)-methylase SpoU
MSPSFQPISTPDDPRVADYRDVKDAEWIKRRGRFMVEGKEVLSVLLARGRYAVASVLIAEKRKDDLAPLLARLPEGTPVYLATDALLEAIAGFDVHRGVLAAADVGAPLDPLAAIAGLSPGPRTILCLEAISNHDNIGGLFRNAAAFGVDLVLLDPRSGDPLYRKSIRTSMGNALTLPFARLAPWPDRLDALEAHGFELVALTPRADALPIEDWLQAPPPPRIALFVGAEGLGLDAPTMAAAGSLRRIRMTDGVDSLNVATAAALALHVLSLSRSA